jgi:hypothetical protein
MKLLTIWTRALLVRFFSVPIASICLSVLLRFSLRAIMAPKCFRLYFWIRFSALANRFPKISTNWESIVILSSFFYILFFRVWISILITLSSFWAGCILILNGGHIHCCSFFLHYLIQSTFAKPGLSSGRWRECRLLRFGYFLVLSLMLDGIIFKYVYFKYLLSDRYVE